MFLILFEWRLKSWLCHLYHILEVGLFGHFYPIWRTMCKKYFQILQVFVSSFWRWFVYELWPIYLIFVSLFFLWSQILASEKFCNLWAEWTQKLCRKPVIRQVSDNLNQFFCVFSFNAFLYTVLFLHFFWLAL